MTAVTCFAESSFIAKAGKYSAPTGPLTLEIFEPKKDGLTGYSVGGKGVWLEKEFPGIEIRRSKAFLRKEVEGKIIGGTAEEDYFIGTGLCGFLFEGEDKIWFYDGLSRVALFQFYPRPEGVVGDYESIKRTYSDKDPALISRAPLEIQKAVKQKNNGG